ncbi:MAG: pasI [Burkholderiaceae bacterium]|nr:pasI [Burkholderiaceae bacterium]
MVNNALINVSVVYVHTDGTWFTADCALPHGATLADAVCASGILSACPDWQLEQLNVGIYGHRQPLEAILHENDRVEIYRPLKIDPKDRRRVKVNSTRDARKWRQLNQNKSK